MFSFACKACGNAGDKQTDTVKVSFPADLGDKENLAPAPSLAKPPKQIEAEEEQRKLEKEAEEQERLRREQEEQRRREEEERLRLQKLEAERQQRLLEEQRAREAEELRLQQEQEARRRAEEAQKQEQLGRFLEQHGFAGVNEKKKRSGILSSGFAYPLHAAVKAVDAQAVSLLLWAGADASLKDSAKLTPLAFAQKLNKKGSHQLVINVLDALSVQ